MRMDDVKVSRQNVLSCYLRISFSPIIKKYRRDICFLVIRNFRMIFTERKQSLLTLTEFYFRLYFDHPFLFFSLSSAFVVHVNK